MDSVYQDIVEHKQAAAPEIYLQALDILLYSGVWANYWVLMPNTNNLPLQLSALSLCLVQLTSKRRGVAYRK